MFTDQICDAVALLREALPELDPKLVFGRDAARMTEKCAEGERLLATAKMLFAQRTAECGTWRGGRAVTEEQWLAQVSGTSEAAARDTLATAQRLDELPATEDKLRAGKLSLAQATQVTAGASIDPASEAKLLRVAERSGLGRLREEKERVVAAATDELEARRRAKRNRHLRTRANGVETTGTFSGPTEEVADLLHVLKPLAEARFNEARLAGEHESHDAYRFDALVNLPAASAAGTSEGQRPRGPRSASTFPRYVRGSTEAGEVCEIPGVGPVPVAHAREVLSHGLLQLVITDGIDVRTVVSTTRHVPRRSRSRSTNATSAARSAAATTPNISSGTTSTTTPRATTPATETSGTSARSTTTWSRTRATKSSSTTTAPGTYAHHLMRRRPDAQR